MRRCLLPLLCILGTFIVHIRSHPLPETSNNEKCPNTKCEDCAFLLHCIAHYLSTTNCDNISSCRKTWMDKVSTCLPPDTGSSDNKSDPDATPSTKPSEAGPDGQPLWQDEKNNKNNAPVLNETPSKDVTDPVLKSEGGPSHFDDVLSDENSSDDLKDDKDPVLKSGYSESGVSNSHNAPTDETSSDNTKDDKSPVLKSGYSDGVPNSDPSEGNSADDKKDDTVPVLKSGYSDGVSHIYNAHPSENSSDDAKDDNPEKGKNDDKQSDPGEKPGRLPTEAPKEDLNDDTPPEAALNESPVDKKKVALPTLLESDKPSTVTDEKRDEAPTDALKNGDSATDSVASSGQSSKDNQETHTPDVHLEHSAPADSAEKPPNEDSKFETPAESNNKVSEVGPDGGLSELDKRPSSISDDPWPVLKSEGNTLSVPTGISSGETSPKSEVQDNVLPDSHEAPSDDKKQPSSCTSDTSIYEDACKLCNDDTKSSVDLCCFMEKLLRKLCECGKNCNNTKL